MAELISNEKYNGKLGTLDMYQLNGKTVVRVRRSKLSKRQKARMAKTRSGKAHASNVIGSKFGKALRGLVYWRHQADMYYHSAMTGHICKHLLVPTPEKGGIGTRSILAENVHRISSFTANPECPERVLEALRQTKFEQGADGITAVVPEVPVEMLVGSKVDQYRVWVMLKYIDISKIQMGWSQKVVGAPVPMGEKSSLSMAFSPPAAEANEVLVAVVGVQSLLHGRLVEDVRMNGFVFLAVECGVGSSELGVGSGELGMSNFTSVEAPVRLAESASPDPVETGKIGFPGVNKTRQDSVQELATGRGRSELEFVDCAPNIRGESVGVTLSYTLYRGSSNPTEVTANKTTGYRIRCERAYYGVNSVSNPKFFGLEAGSFSVVET